MCHNNNNNNNIQGGEGERVVGRARCNDNEQPNIHPYNIQSVLRGRRIERGGGGEGIRVNKESNV